MVVHQPDHRRETPSRGSAKLLSKRGGKEAQHGTMAILTTLRKNSLTLPTSGMNDFNIFNNMPDTHFAPCIHNKNENSKHQIIRIYKGEDIKDVLKKNS